MSLTTIEKQELVKKFGRNEHDTGSTKVQIAILTKRLDVLNDHFQKNKKDHHSRRGLLKIVGHRRRLLRYLNKKNPLEYKELINELGIRR